LYDKDPNIKKTVDSKKFSAPWRQVRGINTIGKPGIFFNEDGEPIERPAGMPGYKPVVTAGAENGKRLARERIPLSDVELRELQEVAHKYVLEAAAEKAKKAS
jgi:hypothetical protein